MCHHIWLDAELRTELKALYKPGEYATNGTISLAPSSISNLFSVKRLVKVLLH